MMWFLLVCLIMILLDNISQRRQVGEEAKRLSLFAFSGGG
jgi:hypothetical protein